MLHILASLAAYVLSVLPIMAYLQKLMSFNLFKVQHNKNLIVYSILPIDFDDYPFPP